MCAWLLHRNHFWPLSRSLSLSVPLPSISLVPSLKLQYRTKHTVMQRECEAQQSGSSSHHNCIQLLPQCLLHPPLSSLPTLSAPQKTFLLCFSTFCIMCPCLSLYTYYISVTHNLSLFCGNQLRALCCLLHPEALGLNTFFMQGKENIFTLLTALRGAHCSAICNTAIIFLLMFFEGHSSARQVQPHCYLQANGFSVVVPH